MVDYQKIKVRKASGELEPFLEEKVRSSLQRAGADENLINRIIVGVKEELYEGISTKEIYSHVFRFLRDAQSYLASKYSLRQAIMQLGPSGYPFEKFVAGILKKEGYHVKVGQKVKGKCVNHEVDVVAQKDEKRFLVECKFHNRPGTKSEIKDVLYVYARFLDIKESLTKNGQAYEFYQPWLATNTKVTSKVKTYAQCVGMQIFSWNYPDDYSIRFLIEKHGLHPITCLHSLGSREKKKLLEKGIVFCRDLAKRLNEVLPPDQITEVEKELLPIIT